MPAPVLRPHVVLLGALLLLAGSFPAESWSGRLVVAAKVAAGESNLNSNPLLSFPPPPSKKTKRSGPITVPIRRRSSRANEKRAGAVTTDLRVARAVLERDAARMRYYLDGGVHEVTDEEDKRAGEGLEKRASWESLALTSYYGDALYYASVQMGTPPQNIDLMIDTGSTDLWVASSTCRTCNQSLVMPYFDNSQSSFNSAQSSTYHATSKQISLAYADGSTVQGGVARDTISMGSYTVQNQTFMLATSQGSSFSVAGILGLAFPALARTQAAPWWLNALEQFEEPEISIFLTQWNQPTANSIVQPGGQLTFGGRNTSLYDGTISMIPILAERWWTIPILSMDTHGVGNATLTFTGLYTSAVVDTGTTLMYGPASVVTEFYSRIPSAVLASTIAPGQQLDGYYAMPCNTTINARIRFTEEVELVLPATNLMWLSLSSFRPGYCVCSFVATSTLESFSKRKRKRFIGPMERPKTEEGDLNSTAPSDTQPTWLLGDAWLKSVYTVFRKGNGTPADPPSVGFAAIKGVNYDTDGNAIIGANGNGVDGSIGQAGNVVHGGGSNEPTTTSGGGSNSDGDGGTGTRTTVGAAATASGTARPNGSGRRVEVGSAGAARVWAAVVGVVVVWGVTSL